MNSVINCPFWIWVEALPVSICNTIIELGKELEQKEALTGDSTIQGINDEEIRKTKLGWFEKDIWLDNLLEVYLMKANVSAQWNFILKNSQKIQFATYEKGDHYTWHRDSGPNQTEDHYRKLTITTTLSDPNTYKGGDFNLKHFTNEAIIFPETLNKAGSIIVFPSLLQHRVLPVTKGTKYSITKWFTGPDFV